MTLSSTDDQTMTQRQLESTLWAAANALRGPVDPGDFKAYVFPVMFFKWISDTWDYWHAKAVEEWGEQLTDEIENEDYQPFVIPSGCHWADVHNTAVNVGVKLNSTLQKIEQANPDLVGVFGDVNWANKDRLPETALVALLDTFHGVKLDPDHVKGDMLGAAYEYLLREFAEASGKKAGEFFTPRHVVHLLVKILDPQPGDHIVDPACGSGGMLVETVNEVKDSGGDPRTLRLHGQEVNLTTSAIAKMNLYLHGLKDFTIRRGDTFSEPRFVTKGKLDKFDVVIANPPFSLQNWGAAKWSTDPYGRAFCGVPPAKNGDFAWIQHMIATMREDTGRVGVVMPHGVLFRGGKEGEIRRCLLEDKDYLEAVIGLPNNLFYSTSIPVALLIFRKTKPADRAGKVLFVDASARFQAGKNQNTMSDADIDAIHAAYARGDDIDGEEGLHLRLVDMAEIADNGYDLNIGRYITTEAAVEVDVEAALAAYHDARAELRAAERVLDEKLKAAGFDA
ncbi:class I SAM-dependent DNA methyltransferase [uncultured Ornithinimicrobium sp.]|uniref:type I restriction-modification system subunit M n=1 Tax=uncultured Ornithinimicrobium sp. TaxID=259307 RepID=UPI00259142FC|nr:class I SAM-dependent DNA methyltransferase [uncultured Ornithinimicrobium sp.]